ncbi:MAG: permease-like cell division protein FtsX [Bacillota bacterium]|jgi:cell division transport system permease protein
MKFSSFRYIFPQAFSSLRVNGWMTFAAIMTITISLFLCSVFWLVVVNLDANATEVESQVEIVAYVLDSVPDTGYDDIEATIKNIEGVKQVRFISKEEGLETMSETFGENSNLVVALDGTNPLPNSFSVKATTPEQVEKIASSIKNMKQIESVRYGQGSVEKLFSLTDTLRKASLAIMILLGVGAIILVAMATRLTVYARRKEVMVMKWVGATNAFIRWPFIIEGILLGIFGAVIAAVIAMIAYTFAVNYFTVAVSFLTFIEPAHLWAQVLGGTVIAGIVMGVFGSLISVARFLDV